MSPMERHGQRVEGSSYFRAFCVRCREPMRVTQERINEDNYCEQCDPPHMGVGNPTPSSTIENDPDAWGRAER